MKQAKTTKKWAICASAAVFSLASQASLAHTRLQTPTINEGERVYNNVVIGHGCSGGITTIGTSVVFPDSADATITVNGQEVDTPLSEIITGGGVGKVRSASVFSTEAVKTDANGNVIGFWSGGGEGLTDGLLGLIPFRTNAYTFNADSCAKSVRMIVSIADICEITAINGFNDSTVMMWTPAVGSGFDGQGLNGYDSPATLTINRTQPLPASCGAGDDVVVTPSAAQLNRDLPIRLNGTQIWPRQ